MNLLLDTHLMLWAMQLADAGFAQLPVRWAHAAQVALLPQGRHRDPFDRLLVAQAMSEPMHLLTCDAALRPYTDLVIDVAA